MKWWLPPSYSTYGGDIDSMFYLILFITGTIFVAVELMLIVFLLRYRRREGERATYTHGNKRLEIVWTIIPAMILVFLAISSGRLWSEIRSPSSFPEDAMRIEVTAKQFEWNVRYAGPDGEFFTKDDVTSRNRMNLPVGTPVRVSLNAEDVIHSFFVPVFRIKQDAVPGLKTEIWFEATETGDYELACAELCGLGHYRMRASVTVQTPEGFAAWLQKKAPAEAAPAEELTAEGEGDQTPQEESR